MEHSTAEQQLEALKAPYFEMVNNFNKSEWKALAFAENDPRHGYQLRIVLRNQEGVLIEMHKDSIVHSKDSQEGKQLWQKAQAANR